jgi:hypothetical protein
MEEGKIATAWAQFGATERSINVYKNACAATGNTLLRGAGSDQFQLLLVNQPVVLLQLNVRENGRRVR